MTRNGASPIIRKSTINVIGTLAFISASRIMFARICQIASLLSLFLTLSMLGGSYYAFRFVTSEQFKARVMNEILDNVSGMMPEILDNALPDFTGPTIPEFQQPKI
tara:strand:+ start:389 stop:706 length:318 start_codon:yes stop_codon:yes gene_type:complete